ncbi:MAG: hypothetical protein ACPG1Z_02825, partial [Planctomycetota bacterium]
GPTRRTSASPFSVPCFVPCPVFGEFSGGIASPLCSLEANDSGFPWSMAIDDSTPTKKEARE